MLGDFGVGKTSLVDRFVRNRYAQDYDTTVGTRVESRTVTVAGGVGMKLVLWDIAGKTAVDALSQSYLRGAGGLLLTADGTREATLRDALGLLMQARDVLGECAVVLMINKLDLVDRWEIAPPTLAELRRTLPVVETSALTGDGVETAFSLLAQRLAS